MALHTVAQLKDSVAGLLSGIDLNNVDNLDGALERAARTLVQKADVPEASGIQNITLYSGVFDYACDPRIFGTAVNDVRPQGITRMAWNASLKTDQESFDRTKLYPSTNTRTTFQYENGVPIIRIDAPFPVQEIIIDPMNQIGNWVAGGSLSNLAVDSTVYYAAPGSLRFTLTGSSAGTLTETLNSSIDISSYEGVGVAFLAIEIPTGVDATDLTSISLKLGSDSGNYSMVTKTTGFIGAWVTNNWLLVAFDFAGATNTGTPNWSAINYVQLTFNHTATMVNFRVGGLWISLPSPAQILFQSAAIFLPVGTTDTLTSITSNTDIIILNDPAYTIYEVESAIAVLQQTGASESSAMMQTFMRVLNGDGSVSNPGLYNQFRGDNPSQELRTVGDWYDPGSSTNNYGGSGSGGW